MLAGLVTGAVAAGVVVTGVVVGGSVTIVMRPRGAVSIGADAIGAVVVVGAVVVEVVEAGDPDDEHAPANSTAPRSATHRPGPRRTLS